ncbi:MAG: DapH/DapD/GlmU-related protein [Dermabacter sp.]|nr:DapH/DapD/GlmU-related protein [Dermabacter sp.]
MQFRELREELLSGRRISASSPLFGQLHEAAARAQQVTAHINTGYVPQERIRELLSELTGREVPDSVSVFPQFTADFGWNIEFGPGVFLNSGCRFQDQGGITLGEGALLGHNVVLATMGHDERPDRRADLITAPVSIGKRAWLAANVTVLPGVSIGDDAIIGAGSLVTRDVPAGMIAVGSPARVLRPVEGYEGPTP